MRFSRGSIGSENIKASLMAILLSLHIMLLSTVGALQNKSFMKPVLKFDLFLSQHNIASWLIRVSCIQKLNFL